MASARVAWLFALASAAPACRSSRWQAASMCSLIWLPDGERTSTSPFDVNPLTKNITAASRRAEHVMYDLAQPGANTTNDSVISKRKRHDSDLPDVAATVAAHHRPGTPRVSPSPFANSSAVPPRSPHVATDPPPPPGSLRLTVRPRFTAWTASCDPTSERSWMQALDSPRGTPVAPCVVNQTLPQPSSESARACPGLIHRSAGLRARRCDAVAVVQVVQPVVQVVDPITLWILTLCGPLYALLILQRHRRRAMLHRIYHGCAWRLKCSARVLVCRSRRPLSSALPRHWRRAAETRRRLLEQVHAADAAAFSLHYSPYVFWGTFTTIGRFAFAPLSHVALLATHALAAIAHLAALVPLAVIMPGLGRARACLAYVGSLAATTDTPPHSSPTAPMSKNALRAAVRASLDNLAAATPYELRAAKSRRHLRRRRLPWMTEDATAAAAAALPILSAVLRLLPSCAAVILASAVSTFRREARYLVPQCRHRAPFTAAATCLIRDAPAHCRPVAALAVAAALLAAATASIVVALIATAATMRRLARATFRVVRAAAHAALAPCRIAATALLAACAVAALFAAAAAAVADAAIACAARRANIIAAYNTASYRRCFFGRLVTLVAADLAFQCRVASASAAAAIGLLRRPVIAFLVVATANVAATGDDVGYTSRPPAFAGTRTAWTAWTIVFFAWVAWKITDASNILSGDEAMPTDPEDASAVPDAEGPLPDPAPSRSTALAQLKIASALDAAEAAETGAAAKAAARRVKLAALQQDWLERNVKLYGAIVSAMPDWLKTSVHLKHRNDGVGAWMYLKSQFDSTDANDRAAAMQKLYHRHIDPRADISEDDLRLQYDCMMVAEADFVNAGGNQHDDTTLQSIFDNALPPSYTTIRQLVRRSAHGTFSAHFADYLGQAKAEVSARAPVANAFHAAPTAGAAQQAVAAAATANGLPRPPTATRAGGRNRDGGGRDASGGGGDKIFCVRCLRKHEGGRAKCTARPADCRHCHCDHHHLLCPFGDGGTHRESMSRGARNLVDREANRARGDQPPQPNAHAAAANAPPQQSPPSGTQQQPPPPPTAQGDPAAVAAAAAATALQGGGMPPPPLAPMLPHSAPWDTAPPPSPRLPLARHCRCLPASSRRPTQRWPRLLSTRWPPSSSCPTGRISPQSLSMRPPLVSPPPLALCRSMLLARRTSTSWRMTASGCATRCPTSLWSRAAPCSTRHA